MTHASIPPHERAARGLSDTLIRSSPGIEHADDLIEDLLKGLAVGVREASLREDSPKGESMVGVSA